MLVGERVYLRPMEERDVADRVRWFNDPRICLTLGMDFPPVSEVGTRQWLQRAALNNRRKDFIICLRADNRPIGSIGLRDINWRHSKAETYLAVGEREAWGKGYGKEAQRLLLEYSFVQLGLNRLYLYTLVENERMVRLNQGLGFAVEGTLRSDVFDHSEYRDRVVMGITAAVYKKRFLQAVTCTAIPSPRRATVPEATSPVSHHPSSAF